MLIVHVDQVTINTQHESIRLLDQQGVHNRQIMLASLIMIHCRYSNRYYVCKNRMTGSHGWVDPWEAKGLMQSHIDSLSNEINVTISGSQADWLNSVPDGSGVGSFAGLQLRQMRDEDIASYRRAMDDVRSTYYTRSTNTGE